MSLISTHSPNSTGTFDSSLTSFFKEISLIIKCIMPFSISKVKSSTCIMPFSISKVKSSTL